MMRIFGKSIRNKVAAAILLTTLVSLTVSFCVLIASEWHTAETALVERMNTTAQILRENIAAAVAFRAVGEADKMMSALELDNEVVAAALYGEDGDRMAGYVRSGADYALPDTVPRDGVRERTDAVVIVLPIETGGERIGTFLLAADYGARNQRFILYLAIAGSMFALSIAIAFLLSRILEERISKPILSLVESTRRVTRERDYSVRVKQSDTVEVSLLAESFNQMLREVNQREVQLTQAMDRLQLTLDASKTYTWEWNRSDGHLQWQSTAGMPTALAQLQGCGVEEILQRVRPMDQPHLTQAYERAMRDQDEFEFEFELMTDDEPLELACRGKGFRDEEHQLVRVLGVVSDVTQRRQTERALYWREQEFRALVEHSPDIIARYSRELRVKYVNPAAERYTGIPLEKVQGLTLQEIGVSEERIRHWRIAIERIFNGASQAEIEFEYKHPNGAARSFLARLVPEFAPSGDVEHVLAVSRDITERKQYEQELRAAKERAESAAQAKSTFLSNMSHDIRTPLTTILGCAELLEDKGDEESKEMIEMVKAGGKRLMDTLNSVLHLAQLEGGDAEMNYEAVDVAKELTDIVRLFSLKAEEKQIQLVFHAPEEPVIGQLDRAAFTRVMMNILGNALKFTAQGSIGVRLWKKDELFYVSVEDTGPGIPKETLSNIFDAFTRSRQSEVQQVEGSGLGMTITRQLVRLMKGDILVESEVGKGSVFTIQLHCSKTSPVSEPPRKEPLPLPSSADPLRSVLAIEDNPYTMRLLELLLSKKYETVLVSSGREALDQARRRGFDVVLMDLGLETSEAGIGYMKEMRSIGGYRATPIIAFTAHALPGEAERFRRLGFDDYLGKPFTAEALEEVIDRCLKKVS